MRIVRVERIKEPPYKRKSPIWLVSFNDLVMLLLAYFILLYAVSQPTQEPWKEAAKSMRLRFGGESEMTTMTGNPGDVQSKKAWTSDNSDPGLDLHYLHSVLQKQIYANEALKDLVITDDRDAVVIALPATTSFEAGDDRISAAGRVLISQLAPILSRLPNVLEVVGHADSNMVNSDGRFGSNWHLSLARSLAVAESLQKAGYGSLPAVRGRGTADMDLLPKNLPEPVRNEMARRVDLRLRLTQP